MVKVPRPKHFNPQLYALKALGIATAIVGVTAVCVVGVGAWYMDVNDVSPPNFPFFFPRLCEFGGFFIFSGGMLQGSGIKYFTSLSQGERQWGLFSRCLWRHQDYNPNDFEHVRL